ncbi:putative gp57 [Burkholderia cepacia]|uniref:Gp57 n=1 Tax=Burkholderia cepacia TaxID=292 RepID=A0AA88Z672_BURCE|nr:putative gp57 [Burkholderia cepacia]
MLRNNVTKRLLMPLLPALLLTACAGKSPHSSPTLGVPALPSEARQPATPSICSPKCSAGLTSARESWRRSLTSEASPASSANAVTTH